MTSLSPEVLAERRRCALLIKAASLTERTAIKANIDRPSAFAPAMVAHAALEDVFRAVVDGTELPELAAEPQVEAEARSVVDEVVPTSRAPAAAPNDWVVMALEALRNDHEGVELAIPSSNPEFDTPQDKIYVTWDFGDVPTEFSGDSLTECLREALAHFGVGRELLQ